MVALQVREVPDAVRDVLSEAAERRGLSMQAFLLEVLEREARHERNRQLVSEYRPPSRVGGVAPGTAAIVRAQREERERELLEALGDL